MTVFELIRQNLDKEIEAFSDKLLSGTLSDYAEYRSMTGTIRGLRIALSEIDRRERAYLEGEDDS